MGMWPLVASHRSFMHHTWAASCKLYCFYPLSSKLWSVVLLFSNRLYACSRFGKALSCLYWYAPAEKQNHDFHSAGGFKICLLWKQTVVLGTCHLKLVEYAWRSTLDAVGINLLQLYLPHRASGNRTSYCTVQHYFPQIATVMWSISLSPAVRALRPLDISQLYWVLRYCWMAQRRKSVARASWCPAKSAGAGGTNCEDGKIRKLAVAILHYPRRNWINQPRLVTFFSQMQ